MTPNSIYDVLAHTAARTPDAPALKVLDGDRYVPTSFARLEARVRALGTGLLELGMRRGEPVGLLSDNRLEWLLADLAITSIGAADVPRGTETPAAELEHILAHSGARTVFVEDAKELRKVESLAGRLRGLKTAIVLDPAFEASREGGDLVMHPLKAIEARGRDLVEAGDRRFLEAAASLRPEDLLTIIYTSGTTGRPKGVELTHGNLLYQTVALPPAVRATAEDRWLSILPPWHVFERAVEYACLAIGCSTAYAKPLRPILVKALELERPTMMAAVPRVLESLRDGVLKNVRKEGRAKERIFHFFVEASRRLFQAEVELEGRAPDRRRLSPGADLARRARARAEVVALSPLREIARERLFRKIRDRLGGRLRAVISGGAALPGHLDDFFHAVGVPVLEGYGLTETAPVLAVRTPGRSAPFTVGHPLRGTDIAILDERGERLPPGVQGRVTVRGPQVMRGYHRDLEATRAVLGEDGRFDTGDLGYLLPGGELKLTGRAKDMIVFASGEKVEPEPLETRLRRSPLISQVLVTGQDEKQLCALIVPNYEALTEQLRRAATPDVVSDPAVRALYRHEIARELPDSTTKPYERVRKFTLIAREWTVGEELTPTLKMKRDVIRKRYQEAIAGAT